MNRIAVCIDGNLTPVNTGETDIHLKSGKPKRIGDDVIVIINKKEIFARFLKSQYCVKNATYLVDLANNEAWEYKNDEAA